MPEPYVGASVLYAVDDEPAQAAVITQLGVDDDDKETRKTDVWLTVLPAGAAPYALQVPASYDASNKPQHGTWSWPKSSTTRTAAAPKTPATPKDKGDGA